MDQPSNQDERAWRYLREWLAGDDQGRRILEALATDPEAGVLALRKRLDRDQPPAQVTNNLRDTEVGKFATFARADRVFMGDQYYYSDQSRHYIDQSTTAEFDQFHSVRSATGIARPLMIGGILLALLGIALTAYDSYVFYNNTVIQIHDAFNRGVATGDFSGYPPTITIPGEIFATLGIVFAGLVLFIIGGVMRPKRARRRMTP